MSLIPRDFFDSFHDFDNFLFPTFYRDLSRFRNSYQPPMDLVEKEDGLYATLEVPGLSIDNLSIELQNNTLIISGQKYSENKKEENQYRLFERRSGSFSRSFSVYPNTKNEDILASYRDGVLNIKVNKNNRKDEKQYIKISN